MRIEQSKQSITHTAEKRWVPGQPAWQFQNKITGKVQTLLFSRSDVVANKQDNFGFRKPSPYKGDFMEYVIPTCTHEWISGPNSRDWQYRVTEVAMSFKQVFGNGASLNFSDYENTLKQQCLRSIKDQKVNLSMAIAFLPQTLNMLRGKFSLATNVLRAAQRRDWRSVGSLLQINPKSSSSFYLEVLFGWLQLMRDITGIAEELQRKCNKPKYRYFYGRARRSQLDDNIWLKASPYHDLCPAWYTFQGERKIEHSAVMIYRGEASVLSRASQLGLTNPAELLWDLVPWSWVVNLGISIGDFVATLDATVGLTYLGGSYTQFGRIRGPVVLTPYLSRNARTVRFTSSPGFYDQKSFNRRVINDKIDPFVLKNPFDAPIALTAAVIAAAVQRGRKATPQPTKGPTRFVYRTPGKRNLPSIPYKP